MKPHLREFVSDALYPIKAYNLPSVCERYGLTSGTTEEAFASKRIYVMSRLEKLSSETVLGIARQVAADFPNDSLQAAIEQWDSEGFLVSEITRQHIAEALNPFSLGGKLDLVEMLRKYWYLDSASPTDVFSSLADDIYKHAVHYPDWTNSEVLARTGFAICSQALLFQFLEDVVHPIRRGQHEQQEIVAVLNPILLRDGFLFSQDKLISGYPTYRIQKTTPSGSQPADNLISQVLISFDENGVHHAWQKALERRTSDPAGAITSAKTLLETVCKHIIDEAGKGYGDNDDLPKLYSIAAECMQLAPSQHSEIVFKSILGNCQSIVGNLAGLRNKLGDSHGQGKLHVRPAARHAELAVNLAGSVAMFLISTWHFHNA